MALIELPYASGSLSITIPDVWLGELVHPQPVAPAPDVGALVSQALAYPIGAQPLAKLARPGQRVALIVDDYTRKTPIDLLLPAVLEQLLRAGTWHNDIRIVVALGTHRPMTSEELAAKVGADIVARYEIINCPSTAHEEMVYLGDSSHGIPAWVQRAVVEADLRIGIGMITPHMDAGFSGGAKIILPGVCDSRSVDAFHATSAFDPENQLGRVNAPLRRSLESFVAERVPLSFVVNVITDLEREIYQCVAGHAVQAHRAGVEHARTVFGVPIRRRYPVVVANCYPYDVDWWQSAKGAWSGDLVTAPGGALVLVTAAPEGHSTYPLVPGYTGRSPEEVRAEISAGEARDEKQAAAGVMMARLKQRVKLSLVSDGIEAEDAELMGIDHYAEVEAAVSDAVTALPRGEQQGSVAVIPQAGIVLPLVG